MSRIDLSTKMAEIEEEFGPELKDKGSKTSLEEQEHFKLLRADPDYFKAQEWMTKKLHLVRNSMPKFWIKQLKDHHYNLANDEYYKNIIFAFQQQFSIPMIRMLPRSWKE